MAGKSLVKISDVSSLSISTAFTAFAATRAACFLSGTVRSGIQPRQLPAAAGPASGHSALVPDNVAREADQDWGEDCPSCPIRDVPNGGSGDSPAAFSTDPTADRTAENEKTVTCTGMTLCLVEQIPAFANERGNGEFPESCCGILGTKCALRRTKMTSSLGTTDRLAI